jgi:hypothetical protein
VVTAQMVAGRAATQSISAASSLAASSAPAR